MPLCAALDARLVASQNTGDTSYWRGLVKGMATQPGDFQLLLLSNTPQPPGIPEDPRIMWVQVNRLKGRLWSLVDFPMSARSLGAQVIHGQYNMSPICGRRAVTTIHDVSFFVEPAWFKRKDAMILRSGVPATVARVAKVITVSETSKAEIEKYIPAANGKTVVTYNALGDNIIPVSRAEAQKFVAERFGVKGPFVLTAGTRWPRKNVKLAVDIAAALPESSPLKVVICGHAGWGQTGAGWRVMSPGYVTDAELSNLYCAADAYVCTSLHEGFGIPLLEAWACGCPVVCGQGGALPEVAADAALVMGDYDARHWADSLTTLLADSGKLGSMREKGTARLKAFSWSDAAAKTLAVYREVADR